MSANPQDLRVASDAVLRDLEALMELEERKRLLALDDPALTDLATQIHAIAGRVLDRTGRQRALAEAASAGIGPTASIAATPRSPASILAEWRQLERRAAATAHGSAERAEVEILLDKVREEYRAAVDVADRRNGSS